MDSNIVKLKSKISSVVKKHSNQAIAFSEKDRDTVAMLPKNQWCTESISYLDGCLPQEEIKIGRNLLLAYDRIIQESTEMIPGAYISIFGFIPIALYYSGDPYVLEAATGKVFYIEHGKYERNGIDMGWNSTFTKRLPRIPINKDNIILTSESSFDDLFEFFDFLDRGP